MTRLDKLRANVNIKEPIDKVFLFDYLYVLGKAGEQDVFLSIYDMLKIWGYEQYYSEMIDIFYRMVVNHPDETICCHYDMGEFNQDYDCQKLLSWDIFDEKTQKFGLVGGVLFQHGEMSFHT